MLLNGKLEEFIDHLTEDVRWHLHGFDPMEGKPAVTEMLRQIPWERYTFIHRNSMCDGNTLIIEGTLQIEEESVVNEHFYCDVYRFDEDRLTEVNSYLVLTQPELEDEEG